MNQALIDQFEADAGVPAKAIEGLTREELNSHPVPGTWSIQQVVMHLLDSDLVAADRMKRVIAEPNPTLLAYDETLFAKHLNYDKLDPKLACDLFRLNREFMATLLRQQPEGAFEKKGNHTERGPESLADIVQIYVDHVHHHMKFIREKRAKLGK